MNALIVGILAGLISGIILYVLTHFFLKLFRPELCISSKIAESTSSDLLNNTYRIKVQNLSKRDVGDITIKISYRSKTKGHYTFSVKDVPLLHSKRKEGNSITAKINPTQISEDRAETVREFFSGNPTGFIEVEISYSDKSPWYFLWSGIRWSAVQRYRSADVIVENSFFVESSMDPESLLDYKNRYNNC